MAFGNTCPGNALKVRRRHVHGYRRRKIFFPPHDPTLSPNVKVEVPGFKESVENSGSMWPPNFDIWGREGWMDGWEE